MKHDYATESPHPALSEQGIETILQVFDSPKQIALPHIHTAIEFIYIVEGSYRVYADDAELYMSEGDLCLFRSGTVHRTYVLSPNGGKYFVVKIEPSVILGFVTPEYAASYSMPFMLGHDTSKLLWTREELSSTQIKSTVDSLLKEHLNDFYGKESALRIYGAALLISVLRYERKSSDENELFTSDVTLTKQIYKAIIFINRNFDKDISAMECAESINMSYSYFSRSFKRITGKSFKEYLNRTRINQAEKLLLSSDKSVTEICFACGYNNVSYFISQYKLLRGKTPHSFRNGV